MNMLLIEVVSVGALWSPRTSRPDLMPHGGHACVVVVNGESGHRFVGSGGISSQDVCHTQDEGDAVNIGGAPSSAPSCDRRYSGHGGALVSVRIALASI